MAKARKGKAPILNEITFRASVFQYLTQQDDLAAIKMKDIRASLESHFCLPDGSLKSGEYRALLEKFATEFISTTQDTGQAPEETLPIPAAGKKRKYDDDVGGSSDNTLIDGNTGGSASSSQAHSKKPTGVPNSKPQKVQASINSLGSKSNQPPVNASSSTTAKRSGKGSSIDVDEDISKTNDKDDSYGEDDDDENDDDENEDINPNVKRGKFSAKEKVIIQEALTAYCARMNKDEKEICPYFKTDEEVGTRKRGRYAEGQLKDLMTDIQDRLVVKRNPKAIYQCMMRMILRKHVQQSSFTPAEEKELARLIETHGRNFSLIAREMGKRPDDCKQVLIRMQRKKTGPFTFIEDRALVDAVYEVMNLREGHDPLPVSDIPWTKVAQARDNERIPLDYSRRWYVIVTLYQRYRYPFALGSDTILRKNTATGSWQPVTEAEDTNAPSSSSSSSGKPVTYVATATAAKSSSVSTAGSHQRLAENYQMRVQLLQLLAASEAEDETEIVWSDLDLPLQMRRSGSNWLWRMMKRDCPADDDFVFSFQEKVRYLTDLYTIALEEMGEPVPLAAITLPILALASASTSSSTSAFSKPQMTTGARKASSQRQKSTSHESEVEEDELPSPVPTSSLTPLASPKIFTSVVDGNDEVDDMDDEGRAQKKHTKKKDKTKKDKKEKKRSRDESVDKGIDFDETLPILLEDAHHPTTEKKKKKKHKKDHHEEERLL